MCTIAGGDAAVGSGLAAWDDAVFTLDQIIIVDGVGGRGWDGGPGSVPEISCSDIYNNEGGDWVGGMAPLGDFFFFFYALYWFSCVLLFSTPGL